MPPLLSRFLSFDRLIGPDLVRLVYYVGALGIIAFAGFAFINAMAAIFGGNLGAGLSMAIAAPAVGVVALVYWRFLCELFMLAFKAYQRLEEIRDRLPDYSGF